MNAKELHRNARESLDVIAIPNIVDNEVRYYQLEERVKKLAEHILATVREDDDELIDENWLFSMGALSTSASYFNIRGYLDDGHTTVQLVKMDGQWNARLVSQSSAVNARLVKTRWQLRNLLESLGVK